MLSPSGSWWCPSYLYTRYGTYGIGCLYEVLFQIIFTKFYGSKYFLGWGLYPWNFISNLKLEENNSCLPKHHHFLFVDPWVIYMRSTGWVLHRYSHQGHHSFFMIHTMSHELTVWPTSIPNTEFLYYSEICSYIIYRVKDRKRVTSLHKRNMRRLRAYLALGNRRNFRPIRRWISITWPNVYKILARTIVT